MSWWPNIQRPLSIYTTEIFVLYCKEAFKRNLRSLQSTYEIPAERNRVRETKGQFFPTHISYQISRTTISAWLAWHHLELERNPIWNVLVTYTSLNVKPNPLIAVYESEIASFVQPTHLSVVHWIPAVDLAQTGLHPGRLGTSCPKVATLIAAGDRAGVAGRAWKNIFYE